MNDELNDNLIDRYIHGRMKPSEEQEFQQLLKLDPQLRALLDADQLLRETVRKDRDAIPEENPQIYTHFLGLLAATAPVGGALAGAKGAATAATTTGKGTLLGTIVGSTAIKTVVATIGVIGVAVGTYVAVPRSSGSGEKEATGTTVQERRFDPKAEAPPVLSTESPVEQSRPTPEVRQSLPPVTENDVKEQRSKSPEHVSVTDDRSGKNVSEQVPSSVPDVREIAPTVVPESSADASGREPDVPAEMPTSAKVIRSNKVKTKVMIETPRKK